MPSFGALFGAQGTELAHQAGERSFAAEHCALDLGQFCRGGCARDLRGGFRLESIELFGEGGHVAFAFGRNATRRQGRGVATRYHPDSPKSGALVVRPKSRTVQITGGLPGPTTSDESPSPVCSGVNSLRGTSRRLSAGSAFSCPCPRATGLRQRHPP